MEMIMIEKRVYDRLLSSVETLAAKVAALCDAQDKRLKTWLDNEEVCTILNISKKTLIHYRERGLLPYAQIKHKIYYKPEDVERLLKQSRI